MTGEVKLDFIDYTSIGKTGVISEMATLFRLDGEPEMFEGFSSESGRKRCITASKSRDIWKALYASTWTPSRLNNAYVLLHYYHRRIDYRIWSYTNLYARYTLTCASDRRWSLDRAWSDARLSWGRWRYIYNFYRNDSI